VVPKNQGKEREKYGTLKKKVNNKIQVSDMKLKEIDWADFFLVQRTTS
jgi:hypothetical protein